MKQNPKNLNLSKQIFIIITLEEEECFLSKREEFAVSLRKAKKSQILAERRSRIQNYSSF